MNKLTLLLLPLLFVVGCSGSQRAAHEQASERRVYPASDKHIQVMGRHLVDDEGAVRFGASGVTFFMKFRGTELAVELEDAFRDSTGYNWFTVVVDGGEASRFRTRPRKHRYTLVDGLQPGVHTLALSKATEGQNGHNRLVAVHTKRLLAPDPLPERKIAFIGNSITSGYGLDDREIPCDEATWFDPTHAWLAYGPRLARRLEAQWMLSSVSGIGMHRNWNSPGPTMPDVYDGVYMEYTDDVTPWDFSRYSADLVVIALGTNDFSEGDGEQPRPGLDGEAFVADYTQFVGTVREKYPDAQILLLNSPMLGPDERERLAGYLQTVAANARAAGDMAIRMFTFDHQYASGCDAHPSLQEHAQMANTLEPVLRAFMGW